MRLWRSRRERDDEKVLAACEQLGCSVYTGTVADLTGLSYGRAGRALRRLALRGDLAVENIWGNLMFSKKVVQQ